MSGGVCIYLDYRRQNQAYIEYLKHALFLQNHDFPGCFLIFSAYLLHLIFENYFGEVFLIQNSYMINSILKYGLFE